MTDVTFSDSSGLNALFNAVVRGMDLRVIDSRQVLKVLNSVLVTPASRAHARAVAEQAAPECTIQRHCARVVIVARSSWRCAPRMIVTVTSWPGLVARSAASRSSTVRTSES